MTESWLPRYLSTPSEKSSGASRWLRSKTGIITTLWLGLIVAAGLMRRFTSDVSIEVSAAPSLLISNKAASSNNFWPGWEGITHMFVFGDSYTTTKFNYLLTQPSIANPLGNPPFPGNSSSAGPNWVAFLTGTYNATFLKTANLAFGAATIDNDIIPPFVPVGKSFKHQVREWYLPTYASHPTSFNWKADNTLFASWMGLNDVLGIVGGRNLSSLEAVFASYADTVDTLYQSGARNFLLLTVPPHERSPISTRMGDMRERAYYIGLYNSGIERIAANLSETHADATAFVFDAHGFFNEVLDDPCSCELTCQIRNTTRSCAAYNQVMLPSDAFDQECGVPVSQYFWKDAVHPTFTIMNAMSKAIVERLSAREELRAGN